MIFKFLLILCQEIRVVFRSLSFLLIGVKYKFQSIQRLLHLFVSKPQIRLKIEFSVQNDSQAEILILVFANLQLSVVVKCKVVHKTQLFTHTVDELSFLLAFLAAVAVSRIVLFEVFKRSEDICWLHSASLLRAKHAVDHQSSFKAKDLAVVADPVSFR